MKKSIKALLLLSSVWLLIDKFCAERVGSGRSGGSDRPFFVYLKNDCGYQDLPDAQIRRALVFFARQNRWDLSNYGSFNMKSLGADSYQDLSGIAVPNDTKCKSLARDSLSLLAYVK